MDAKNFETTIAGKEIKLVSIQNRKNLRAAISNFGARLVNLVYNDVHVIVSFGKIEDYFVPPVCYHGATIGRYGNRIKNGEFKLHEEIYTLPVNNGPNHLHGGPNGFHNQVWEITEQKENSISLRYHSKDGEEGYPGNLDATVTFTTTEDDALEIVYRATTDAATPVNLTNHAYFNLNGGGTAKNHQLQINADHYTPVDETLIPTGIEPVAGTAFDFRSSKPIGRDIDNDEKQIKIGGGYDHNFVLNKEEPNRLSLAATAIGDKSGIVMETFTEEPGVQLFSANFDNATLPNSYRTSFCLETQHFPNSPNEPSFPNTILVAGQTFSSKTIYKFSKSE
ncbi:aldose epimerase family protein [Flavisolibacter nicotianae]|uniref:aldose epimerase family protein n=1 Tax=Flavisolibacter nicotianae TaxID=2364882 RepID=UPI000EB2E2F6|nr:aldose epimerase family protein [Flavisolibacter nicotianae]